MHGKNLLSKRHNSPRPKAVSLWHRRAGPTSPDSRTNQSEYSVDRSRPIRAKPEDVVSGGVEVGHAEHPCQLAQGGLIPGQARDLNIFKMFSTKNINKIFSTIAEAWSDLSPGRTRTAGPSCPSPQSSSVL